ncbi:MAG TPA: NAD(P)-binding domain-containing protein [Candidatus Limnocylindria bacterium]|nr:NAD(P)-binding domain-containing protein [Candidatus Limnocylindria bacterium]
MSAPAITLFSLNQRDADLGVRERLARSLSAAGGPDRLVLLTCHRAEILVADGLEQDALAVRLGTDLPPAGHLRRGRDAVRQLLRVVCGLDSAIRGEAQILGQLRRAFDTARDAGDGLHPALALVIRRALEVGRELRRTTPLGSVRRTLGSLAVDAALEGVPDPTNATVLVIGAGEVGKLALRALGARTGAVILANRDAERAEAVAAEHGARAVPLERIDDALAQAAVVIAAADTRGAVLTPARLTARLANGPLTIIDLAVPRSVPPEARALDGLRYVDVDALAAGAGTELDDAALADIEARCDEAADAIMRELRAREAVPAISALRDRAEAIRTAHLARALARLQHLPERDRRVVESLSEALAHALIHEPTVRLRESPEREASARDLFKL